MKLNIKPLIASSSGFVKKYSPQILTGLGVGSAVASVYLTYKATIKATSMYIRSRRTHTVGPGEGTVEVVLDPAQRPCGRGNLLDLVKLHRDEACCGHGVCIFSA